MHVVLVVCFAGVSCSSKEDSPNPGPTSPTPTPTATPTSLSISGPNTLRTGQSSSYTATLTLSNGTTQTVTPGWTPRLVLAHQRLGSGQCARSWICDGCRVRTRPERQHAGEGLPGLPRDVEWRSPHPGMRRTRRLRRHLQSSVSNGLGSAVSTEPHTDRGECHRESHARRNTNQHGWRDFRFTALRRWRFCGVYRRRHQIPRADPVLSTCSATAAALSGSMIFTIEALGFAGNTYIESELSSVSRTSSIVSPARTLSFSSVDDFLQGFGRQPN